MAQNRYRFSARLRPTSPQPPTDADMFCPAPSASLQVAKELPR